MRDKQRLTLPPSVRGSLVLLVLLLPILMVHPGLLLCLLPHGSCTATAVSAGGAGGGGHGVITVWLLGPRRASEIRIQRKVFLRLEGSDGKGAVRVRVRACARVRVCVRVCARAPTPTPLPPPPRAQDSTRGPKNQKMSQVQRNLDAVTDDMRNNSGKGKGRRMGGE